MKKSRKKSTPLTILEGVPLLMALPHIEKLQKESYVKSMHDLVSSSETCKTF